jgi:hypothetical protein
MLWTLDGLVRFGRDGAPRHAAWAAAGFVAAYCTCQQYALLFAGFAVAAAIVALTEQRFRARPTIALAAAALGAGLVVLLVAWPALSLHDQLGLSRPAAVVQGLSAQPADFLSRPGTAWLGLPGRSWADKAGLFPGAILLLLAVGGTVIGWRNRSVRRWTSYFTASALVATLLALGLNLTVAGWQPFETLRSVVPGFDELRSPYRFAIIMQVMLPILATITLSHIRGRVVRRGTILILLLGLLACLENLTVPNPVFRIPVSPQTAWTAWLRAQPAGTVVAHIPFPNGLHVADYEIEGWRLFHQIDHHQPLVNGYSGYFPPEYGPFQLAMAREFPNQNLLCTLNKGLQVDTLVVDRSWLGGHRSWMAAHTTVLKPVYGDNQVEIYRLRMPDGACISA